MFSSAYTGAASYREDACEITCEITSKELPFLTQGLPSVDEKSQWQVGPLRLTAVSEEEAPAFSTSRRGGV